MGMGGEGKGEEGREGRGRECCGVQKNPKNRLCTQWSGHRPM